MKPRSSDERELGREAFAAGLPHGVGNSSEWLNGWWLAYYEHERKLIWHTANVLEESLIFFDSDKARSLAAVIVCGALWDGKTPFRVVIGEHELDIPVFPVETGKVVSL